MPDAVRQLPGTRPRRGTACGVDTQVAQARHKPQDRPNAGTRIKQPCPSRPASAASLKGEEHDGLDTDPSGPTRRTRADNMCPGIAAQQEGAARPDPGKTHTGEITGALRVAWQRPGRRRRNPPMPSCTGSLLPDSRGRLGCAWIPCGTLTGAGRTFWLPDESTMVAEQSEMAGARAERGPQIGRRRRSTSGRPFPFPGGTPTKMGHSATPSTRPSTTVHASCSRLTPGVRQEP